MTGTLHSTQLSWPSVLYLSGREGGREGGKEGGRGERELVNDIVKVVCAYEIACVYVPCNYTTVFL